MESRADRMKRAVDEFMRRRAEIMARDDLSHHEKLKHARQLRR